MNLRLRAFPDRGPLVWFAFSAGIAAWIVHLTLFASVVALVHRRGDFWIFHVGNAGGLKRVPAGAPTGTPLLQ